MRFVDVMDDFTGYIRIPILEVGYSMLCTLGLVHVLIFLGREENTAENAF
jgi:hypothetical protein